MEEQDKVLRPYFAQRGGMRRNGRSRHDGDGRKHVGFDVYISQMNAQTVAGWPNLDSRVFFYLFIKLVSTQVIALIRCV